MHIDNAKIAAFGPIVFSDFRGLSFLLNHRRGVPLSRMSAPELLQCDLRDPNLGLFDEMHSVLCERIGVVSLMERFRFCPLPAATYHVTACDLIHSGNQHLLSGPACDELTTLLRGLPNFIESPVLDRLPASPSGLDGTISLCFERLTVLHEEAALVAVLQPADRHSQTSFARFEEWRRSCDEVLGACGRPPNPPWSPHVTLGYFALRYYLSAAAAETRQWSKIMRAAVRGRAITFNGACLYGFTDMVSFWRRPLVPFSQATAC